VQIAPVLTINVALYIQEVRLHKCWLLDKMGYSGGKNWREWETGDERKTESL